MRKTARALPSSSPAGLTFTFHAPPVGTSFSPIILAARKTGVEVVDAEYAGRGATAVAISPVDKAKPRTARGRLAILRTSQVLSQRRGGADRTISCALPATLYGIVPLGGSTGIGEISGFLSVGEE